MKTVIYVDSTAIITDNLDYNYHICYFFGMEYEIHYHSEAVQNEILDLPDSLAARYLVLTRRMVALGPNLGEPHTKAMKNG